MSKDRWLGGARALLEAAAKIGLRLLNLEVACRVTVRVQEQLPQDAGHGCALFFPGRDYQATLAAEVRGD